MTSEQDVSSEPASPKASRFWFQMKWMALAVCVVFLVWYRMHLPLNAEEKKLLGQWSKVETNRAGTIDKGVWKFNGDRTWVLAHTTEIPATENKIRRVTHGGSFGTWRLRKGQLVLTDAAVAGPDLSEKLENLVKKIIGTPSKNNYFRVNEGRIAFPTPDEMKLQWFDRVTETYGKFDKIPWERMDSSDFEEDRWSR